MCLSHFSTAAGIFQKNKQLFKMITMSGDKMSIQCIHSIIKVSYLGPDDTSWTRWTSFPLETLERNITKGYLKALYYQREAHC